MVDTSWPSKPIGIFDAPKMNSHWLNYGSRPATLSTAVSQFDEQNPLCH
jgi:hypothetical protein